MILGFIGTEYATRKDFDKLEELFDKKLSISFVWIDLFEGEEKIIKEADIVVFFYKEGNEKSEKLFKSITLLKRAVIIVILEDQVGVIDESKERDFRKNKNSGKGIINRFKKNRK